jgi:hypothetical protein
MVTKGETLVVLPVDVVFLQLDIFVDNLVVEFCVWDVVELFIDGV